MTSTVSTKARLNVAVLHLLALASETNLDLCEDAANEIGCATLAVDHEHENASAGTVTTAMTYIH